MHGAFVVLLQVDTWGWEVGYAWRSRHWLVRLDITILTLMLVFTLVILCRGLFLYCLRTTSLVDGMFQVDRRRLVAELCWGLTFVKSIRGTAPALGVAGTCFGVLMAFSGFMTNIFWELAVALLTTAIGLAVGVIAALVENHIQNRADTVKQQVSTAEQTGGKMCTWPLGEDHRRSHKFPLARQFSQLPTFPLMAAPSLAILLALFMPSHISKGFRVHLEGEPVSADLSSALPISIEVPERRTSLAPFVYVNAKKTRLEELKNTLRRELNGSSHATVYVQADGNVSWSDVTNAIDVPAGLRMRVVLLTTPGDSKSNNSHIRSKPKS
jgi:biopolymer transport protein ExbD